MKTTLINYRTYNLNRSKVIPIDRRSIFGNPFHISKTCTREEAVNAYEEWFYEQITHSANFENKILALKGHTLGCWCTPLLCHGDVIIKYLEGSE